MQGAFRTTSGGGFVACARGGPSPFEIADDDGVQLGINGLDSRDHEIRELEGTDLFLSDLGR